MSDETHTAEIDNNDNLEEVMHLPGQEPSPSGGNELQVYGQQAIATRDNFLQDGGTLPTSIIELPRLTFGRDESAPMSWRFSGGEEEAAPEEVYVVLIGGADKRALYLEGFDSSSFKPPACTSGDGQNGMATAYKDQLIPFSGKTPRDRHVKLTEGRARSMLKRTGKELVVDEEGNFEPIPINQGGVPFPCGKCMYNRWGSTRRDGGGRGKACSEYRLLLAQIIYRADDNSLNIGEGFCIIQIPPSKLSLLTAARQRLQTRGMNLGGATLRVSQNSIKLIEEEVRGNMIVPTPPLVQSVMNWTPGASEADEGEVNSFRVVV